MTSEMLLAIVLRLLTAMGLVLMVIANVLAWKNFP